MLRQVYIYKGNERIYEQRYGKALDEESFKGVLKNISKDAFRKAEDVVQYHDFYKYRISYITSAEKQLMFIFITDLSDKFDNIKKELLRCKKEFLLMFEGVIDHKYDKKTFSIFDPTIESIHKNLRPKISLVGFSGVGKTTITRLIRAEEIPTEHIPTITGDIATIKIGNLHFHLWDFAGQEEFSFLWTNFVRGSDAVLLITDSTLENCEKSRFFLDLIEKEAPNARVAVIGNKQDLPDALPISDIERITGLKGYSMVATDSNNRDKMITIIADVLEMSAEVSPLLKPLIERDKKVAEAEKAIENGDFYRAMQLFEEVSDLCIQLGDDVVSQEFHEKAQKIRKILKSVKKTTAKKPSVPSAPTAPPKPKTAAPSAPTAPPKPKTAAPSAPTAPPKPKTATSASSSSNSSPVANLAKLNKMLQGINIGDKPSAPTAPPKPKTATPSAPTAPPKPKTAAPSAPTAPPAPQTKTIPKEKIEAQIVELQIKISNIKSKLVDLEMQNVMGEISDEEYKEKEERLKGLLAKLEDQIKKLEDMKK
ncbi:MAG: ADP-ribosylation factor-like protein [Promethearchaeota archaeon]